MLKYIYNTKKGHNRKNNQDHILIFEKDEFYLFVLFDGVGSYTNNNRFIKEYKKKLREESKKVSEEYCNLENLFYSVHNYLLTLGHNGKSTLSALCINKNINKAKFINIGDSRIYIYTNQFIEQVTTDDTYLSQKKVLSKFLGSKELKLSDFKEQNLNNYEYNFLICSDGFYELMERNLKEYFRTLNFKKTNNIKNKLSILQRNANSDDSSYIIIKNEI
jgi:serine/threonine protein phosphatase PrpC